MIKIYNIIITVFLVLISSGLITTYIVNAQITNQIIIKDKQFEFCPSDLLSTNTYINGSSIKYDKTGCPFSTIIIKDWNNIDSIQQNKIITNLQSSGYKPSIIANQVVCPDNIIDDGTGKLIIIDESGNKISDTDSSQCAIEVRP